MILFFAELFGALLALLLCFCTGSLAVSLLRLSFTRVERAIYSALIGAALISLFVLLAGTAHLLYPSIFVALGIVVGGAAIWVAKRRPQPAKALQSALSPWQRNLFLFVYVIFGFLYLRVALLPESSPDGTRYHTSLIARYLRDHALVPVYTNMYAGLPQGAESVYLIAFAFGRNTAVALVNYAVLMLLPWLILAIFIRWKRPGAGVLAAVLVFTCPIVGYTGTNAYVDAYLVTVLVGMFGLLEIYREQSSAGYAAIAGLLAGYACAVKYTAFPALLYLSIVIVFQRQRSWRRLSIAGACAALAFAPWLLRNALFFGNPLFPFANRLFPNPYMQPAAEMAYRRDMHIYTGIHSLWQLPMEYTVHGFLLQGFIGPVFLLLPLAIWALRYPFGRRLLLAALLLLYGVTQNMGTRFLMPALAFAAAAMALALADLGWVAIAVGAFAAFTAWPSHYNKFVDPLAARIASYPKRIPWTAEEREKFLFHSVGDLYESVALLNGCVPPDARVLTYHDLPDGYINAEVLVSYGGALNQQFYSELRRAVRADSRDEAVRDLVRNGVRFLLIRPDDRGEPVSDDLRRNPSAWPVRLLGETAHYRLYEFEPKQLSRRTLHPTVHTAEPPRAHPRQNA